MSDKKLTQDELNQVVGGEGTNLKYMDIPCPRCKQMKLIKKRIEQIRSGSKVVYYHPCVCLNCTKEFYLLNDGSLLTKEDMSRRF